MARISRALKISLFVGGGLVAVLVLAALAVALFVDFDAYKPRVEAAASGLLGMDVTVEGRMRIGWIPGLHVTLQNVRIRNHGSQIAFVEEADVPVKFLSLLQQNLSYGNIAMKRARISLERGADGKYNYERSAVVGAMYPALELQKVSFSGLDVTYVDKGPGGDFESRNCNGELTRMRHPGGANFLSALSLSGHFSCSQLARKDAPISNLEFTVEATDGIFDFKPIAMRTFGGEGSGSLRIDRSGAVPQIHLDYALKQFHVDEYFKGQPLGKAVGGLMDFSIALSMRGNTRGELVRSAAGEVSLSGSNLTLAGVDLDQELSRYEASQRFNLFDLTAFVFAGPLGLVVTKGTQFAGLMQQGGGSTNIRTVVSKWKLEKGVAHAGDVALTTSHNRLALHGGLDFVDETFDEVVVALVDSNGCAKVRERIRGPFSKPVVEKPGALASIAGPVRNLLRDIQGSAVKCDMFYSGSVAPPA